MCWVTVSRSNCRKDSEAALPTYTIHVRSDNSWHRSVPYLVHPAGSTACADESCAGPLLSLLRVDPEHANGGWW